MSNDAVHVWLRAEQRATKAQRGTRTAWERERRSVLAPRDAAALLAAGFRVTVERSEARIYADSDYADAGYGLANKRWLCASCMIRL